MEECPADEPKRLMGDTLEMQKHSLVQLTFVFDVADERLR